MDNKSQQVSREVNPESSRPEPIILPKKSTGWMTTAIVLLVVLVLGGGYLAYGKWGDTVLKKIGFKKTTEAIATSSRNTTDSPTTNTTTTATTNETANWKTYTDATHSFTVKYPADWTTTNNPIPTSTNIILQINNGLVTNGTNTDGFIVKYYSTITDLKNSGTEYRNITSIDDYINVSSRVIGESTIDGVVAKKITNKTGDDQVTSLIFPKDNHIYILTTDLTQFSSQDDQIISTFKYDQTLSWKTYTIPKNDYNDYTVTFKYPADWSIENNLGKIKNGTGKFTWGRINIDNSKSRDLLTIIFYDSVATLRDTYPDEINNQSLTTIDNVYPGDYKKTGTKEIGSLTFNKYLDSNKDVTIGTIYATMSNDHVIEIDQTQPTSTDSESTKSDINTSLSILQTIQFAK